MDNFKKYKNQKVLILGLGLNEGGVGSAKFFANLGAQVRVTDLKDRQTLQTSLEKLEEFSSIEYILGEHRNEDIDWADLIIRNPALKKDNPYLKYAKDQGKRVELDMGIFLENIDPKQIVGITGTKGKSTTSSLIYNTLISSGKKAIFAGNIGKSVLNTLEFIGQDTLLVLEISSFQLEAFDEHHIAPHIAVITNIIPDHLNYYSSFEEYIQSKKIIGKNQTAKDFLILLKNDLVTSSTDFRENLLGKIIEYSQKDLPEDFKPKLLGQHNLLNISAAFAVSKLFEIPELEALEKLSDFDGVEFRMQLVKKWEGIKIYNDSASTMPESTIQAIEALPSSILIVGGMDKGLDYDKLAQAIDRKVKAVFFLDGTATDKLRAKIQHKNIQRSTYYGLPELLKDLKHEAKQGDTILFSPGATSFNMFQNEFDRGRKFNEALDKVFKEF